MENINKFSIRSYIFNLIAAGLFLLSELFFPFVAIAAILQIIATVYALLSKKFVTIILLVFPLLIGVDYFGGFKRLGILPPRIFDTITLSIGLLLLVYIIMSSICLILEKRTLDNYENKVRFSIISYSLNLIAVGIIAVVLLLYFLLDLILPSQGGESGLGTLIILIVLVVPTTGVSQAVSAIYALLSRRFVTIILLVFPLSFIAVLFNIDIIKKINERYNTAWLYGLILLAYAIISSVCLIIDLKRFKKVTPASGHF